MIQKKTIPVPAVPATTRRLLVPSCAISAKPRSRALLLTPVPLTGLAIVATAKFT